MKAFLVRLKEGKQDEDARADVAECVARSGGFILMALATGALIVALDDRVLPIIEAHDNVDFCGGVTLDPNGKATRQLTSLFSRNLAAQLADRQPATNAASPFPPGYRPLAWHRIR